MPKPLYLLVPGARIELAQQRVPRDFKSLASTCSAIRAIILKRLLAHCRFVGKMQITDATNRNQLSKFPQCRPEHTSCNCRTDYPCYIGCHGVHEKKITGVFLLADGLNHPG